MSTQIAFTVIGFHLLVILLPVSMLVLFKWPQAWHHMIAVFLGLLTGYINLHSGEIQFPILLLLVFGFFIAFSRPVKVWQFAVLLAMWIPIGQFILILAEGKLHPVFQEGIFSLVAFVPAFIGTSAGVVVRRANAHFSADAAHMQQ